MANNDSPYNFGDPVWKPVPRDKDAPFAQTSSGSWTWPKPSGKTSAKGPDWGGNSGKGARKSVISQTSNPAPVKWYDYPDPNGPTPEETMSVAYDNFMANDRAQSVINSAADRYNSTFNPQVLDPTLPPRPPKEISRPPSPIESSWYKPTLWSTLPPPTSIEETLARQAAESGFNLVPYTGPAAADLAQVHAQPLNQNFGYFGAGYHPEYLPPQTGGQPTILAQVELDPQVRYGPPGTATPVTLEEVPIEKTRNPFEIIRRAVMGAIARADNQEPGNGVYSGGAIRGQDASGTGPPVPPPSPYIPPESPHAFRPTLPEPVDTAMLESWFGVSGDPAPTFDQVAGSLGYNIDDPLQFMYDEIDNWGWAASGSKDAVAGLYEELLRDN